MLIRPVERADSQSWERLRQQLWPSDDQQEHAAEIQRFFDGSLREPVEVLAAIDPQGAMIGFIELSFRNYAEGCISDHVAYIEGWYVDPASRGGGVGAALVRAAEDWARVQGCSELASDTELHNSASAAAHRALGFEEVERIICFRKKL